MRHTRCPQQLTNINIPIPSMYGIFTYMWLILMVKCREILYHTWILWDRYTFFLSPIIAVMSFSKRTTLEEVNDKRNYEFSGMDPRQVEAKLRAESALVR